MTPFERDDFVMRLNEVKKQENEDKTALMGSIGDAISKLFSRLPRMSKG
jgi:hypothetical protein